MCNVEYLTMRASSDVHVWWGPPFLVDDIVQPVGNDDVDDGHETRLWADQPDFLKGRCRRRFSRHIALQRPELGHCVRLVCPRLVVLAYCLAFWCTCGVGVPPLRTICESALSEFAVAR